jgi:hypothetical protein
MDARLDGHWRVLHALAIRSDFTTGLTDRRCSTPVLAADLGLALRTVRWHLACLVELGVIVLERPGRGPKPDQYRLAWIGATSRPHREVASVELSTRRQPHREVDGPEAEKARGHTARTSRPHRELARGHTASLKEEDVIPDAGARASVDDSANATARLSMGFIDDLVRDAIDAERQPKPRRPRAGPR